MLKGISPLISPELLKVLDEMGHTDEIVLADANFPGYRYGKRVIPLRGVGIVPLLDAVLKLVPLDSYAEKPVALMQKVEGDPVPVPIWEDIAGTVTKYDARGREAIEFMDKWDFYRRTEERAYAVIMTGETAQYGNVIIKKDVIKPECAGL